MRGSNQSHESFIKRFIGSDIGSYTDGQEVYVQDPNMFSVDCSQDSDGGVIINDKTDDE